jgi:hypothetical protein
MFRVPAGVFEASSDGNVRKAAGWAPAVSPDRDGYLRVKHAGQSFYVHVLVILAWQGPPQVRHLGDTNQDNRPAKLAWGSGRQNGRDKGERTRERREGTTGVSPPPRRLQPVTGDVRG